MRRIFLLISLLAFVAVLLNCSSGSQSAIVSNANATEDTNANNAFRELDPANLPPGLSASPVNIDPNSNIPGIPRDANIDPKKAGPAPGIPSDPEIKRLSNSKAARPAGIPTDDEIRRAMQSSRSNANTPSPAQDPPMMRSVRKTPKP